MVNTKNFIDDNDPYDVPRSDDLYKRCKHGLIANECGTCEYQEENFVNITAPEELNAWLDKHGYKDLDDCDKIYSYGPKRWEFETIDVYKFKNCAVVVENMHKEGFEDIDQAFGYAAERGERSRSINRCFGQ